MGTYTYSGGNPRNGGHKGDGIHVADVHAGDSFPATRADGSPLVAGDWVDPKAPFPFTIGDITFESKNDWASWSGSKWLLNASSFQKTNEVEVKNPADESLSGTANYQNQVNIEVKNKLAGMKVKDVKVDEASIVDTDGTASIPVASSSKLGVVKAESAMGVGCYTSDSHKGKLYIVKATDDEIKTKTNDKKPIVPANLDKAVMEGLGNNSQAWTEIYKANARATIGASQELHIALVVNTTTGKLKAQLLDLTDTTIVAESAEVAVRDNDALHSGSFITIIPAGQSGAGKHGIKFVKADGTDLYMELEDSADKLITALDTATLQNKTISGENNTVINLDAGSVKATAKSLEIAPSASASNDKFAMEKAVRIELDKKQDTILAGDNITIGDDGKTIKSNQIDDTLSTSTTKTWSIDAIKEGIRVMGATYRGTFANKAALIAYSGTKEKNDRAVVTTDETHDNATTMYIFDGSAWVYEYVISDKPLEFDDSTIHINTSGKVEVKDKGITPGKMADQDTEKAEFALQVKADGTIDFERIRQYKSVSTFASESGNDKTLYYLAAPCIIGTKSYSIGLYIWSSATSFKLVADVGGGGGSNPIIVGVVSPGGFMPAKRPDGTDLIIGDFVKPYSGATFPFTISGVTFTGPNDTAVYMTGGNWLVNASVYQKTSETPVNDKTTESIDGAASTAIYQAGINAENATAINAAANTATFEKTSDGKLHLNIKSRSNADIVEANIEKVVFAEDEQTLKNKTIEAADNKIDPIIDVSSLPTSNAKKSVYRRTTDNTLWYTRDGGATWNEVGKDIQKATLPTASASEAGHIYMYTGPDVTTAPKRVHGHFYECKEGTTAGTYEWKDLSTDGDNVPVVTSMPPSETLNEKTVLYNGEDITIEQVDYKRGMLYNRRAALHYFSITIEPMLEGPSSGYTPSALSSAKQMLYSDEECTQALNYYVDADFLYNNNTEFPIVVGTVTGSTEHTGGMKWLPVYSTDYLPLKGGTMAGNINMGKKEITNIKELVLEKDTGLAIKNQLRATVDNNGGTIDLGYESGGYLLLKGGPSFNIGVGYLKLAGTDFSLVAGGHTLYGKNDGNLKWDDRFFLKPDGDMLWNGKFLVKTAVLTEQTRETVFALAKDTEGKTVHIGKVTFTDTESPTGSAGNQFEVEVHSTGSSASPFGYILAKNRGGIYLCNIQGTTYGDWYKLLTSAGGNIDGDLNMKNHNINYVGIICGEQANKSLTLRTSYTNWRAGRLDFSESAGTFKLQAGKAGDKGTGELLGTCGTTDQSGTLTWNGNDISGAVTDITSKMTVTGVTNLKLYKFGKVRLLRFDNSVFSSGWSVNLGDGNAPIIQTTNVVCDWTASPNTYPLAQVHYGSLAMYNLTTGHNIYGELVYFVS